MTILGWIKMSSRRQFRYRGKTLEELKELSMDEFVELLPSRQRRTLTRTQYWTHRRSKLLNDLRKAKELVEQGKPQPEIRTHVRDFIVLPEFVGLTIHVHNGRQFVAVELTPQRIGHYIGEFAPSIKPVSHGAPGVGATRSSTYVPLK